MLQAQARPARHRIRSHQDRRGVGGRSSPGALRRPAPGRHRAGVVGRPLHVDGKGVFRCAGCGAELFDTDAKFESGTGLAQLRPGPVRRHGPGAQRPHLRHGAHRDPVRPVRRPSGTRLPRRAHRHRAALLRQLPLADLRARGPEPDRRPKGATEPGPEPRPGEARITSTRPCGRGLRARPSNSSNAPRQHQGPATAPT